MAEIFNLANYSYNFNSLPYFIFGFITLFFGIFIFISNRRSLSHIGYSLMCLNFFVWMFFLGLANLANNREVMRFWLNIDLSFFGAIFISASTYYFSVGWLGDKRQEKFILPFYLSMVPFAILTWTGGLIIKEMRPVGTFFGYPFHLGYGGPLFLILLSWWFIPVMLASFNIFKAYRVENLAPMEKKRRKLMIFIFFIGYFGSLEWLPFLGINIIYKSFYPVGAFFTFIMCVGVFFYGILKYQLLDIRVIIKRAFFSALGIALISGFVTGITFLSSWFVQVIPGFKFWTVPLFVGVVAFFIGNLFWRKSKQVEKAYEIEKQARQEIEHLSEVKDQFLLATQHHLRTPLTIMKGYLSVLLARKQELDWKTKEDYTEKTLNSTNRLIKLVNELLDISKLQVGKQPLNFQPTNIRNLIEDILQDLQGEIQAKNLQVKILPPTKKDWPLIPADSGKLRIALSNIIDNAVKYTPQGEIIIQGQKTNDSFQISIQDTGIGINPEEIPNLFTRYFERGEQAQKLYTTGRGIGLFIASNIIKAHQGRIWVESEGTGKGARFTIELRISNEMIHKK